MAPRSTVGVNPGLDSLLHRCGSQVYSPAVRVKLARCSSRGPCHAFRALYFHHRCCRGFERRCGRGCGERTGRGGGASAESAGSGGGVYPGGAAACEGAGAVRHGWQRLGAAGAGWPVEGAGEVPVEDGSGAARTRGPAHRPGGLGVRLRGANGAPDDADARTPGEWRASLTSRPGKARVRVAGQDLARRAKVNGVIFALARADRVRQRGWLALDVDYSGFRHAYGGDFGGRLRLMRLPGCVLVSPEEPACHTPPMWRVRRTRRPRRWRRWTWPMWPVTATRTALRQWRRVAWCMRWQLVTPRREVIFPVGVHAGLHLVGWQSER